MPACFLLATALVFLCGQNADVDLAAKARELAHKFIIMDGHIDVPIRLNGKMVDVSESAPEMNFDYPRAVAGGLDAPFMSIYTPASLEQRGTSKEFANKLIDIVREMTYRSPHKFLLATSVADVHAARRSGKIALLMGMENGSPIEGDLKNLELFHRRGVRYITLTHSKDNHICDSSYDDSRTWKGLSPFGRTVVRRMNDLGIVIDVSHISDDSFYQVMELTRAPVFASHSSTRFYTPGFERNMNDEMIKLLAEQAGVIMINFGSTFVDQSVRDQSEQQRQKIADLLEAKGLDRRDPEAREYVAELREQNPPLFADVAKVADHIDHVVQLAGIDHVGFGSDFDGVGDTLPEGLKDVSYYPNLIRVLLERGYNEADIEKICSGNVLRVMSAVEQVSGQ